MQAGRLRIRISFIGLEFTLVGSFMGVPKAVSTLLLVGAWGLLLIGDGIALQESARTQPEDMLKGRVEQFYTLLLSNRMADAEAYVTQDAVQNFRRLTNNPFVGFQVEAVRLDAGGKEAEVETAIFYIHPGSPQPLAFQRKTSWRLENGEWRLFLPLVAPQNVMGANAPGRAPASRAVIAAPTDLRFKENGVNLGIVYKDEKPQARFSFTNTSDHPVQISKVETGCVCLRAAKDDKTYGPGESGEVAIEFDPAEYLFFYKQTVFVKTEPGGRSHQLLIEAQVLPPESRLTQAP